jgi:peptide/nickel transport system substrate-binding protein
VTKRTVVLAAVLALSAACTGLGADGAGPPVSPTPGRGGTLRLAFVADFGGDLDPQTAYDAYQWELFRCCLLRTLFSYNGLPTSEGGAEALPDLAAGPPEISHDGLTWTFRIKPGIHYAPPLEDVEITSRDFIRALMREASPAGADSYAFYYSVIEGFDAYASGDADTISGLETPDEHTLVIRLTEPAGDLPNRLALGATAPIPPNPYRPDAVMGAAEGHEQSGCVERQPDGKAWVACGYGHWLVASGPYMIEGSEDLDLSLEPDAQAPIAGFSTPAYVKPPGEPWTVAAPGSLTLVRNPSWDPTTDDLRAAYADRIELEIRAAFVLPPESYDAVVEELTSAVEEGTLDHVLDLTYPEGQIRRYRSDPEMDGHVLSFRNGGIQLLVMNLAVPPFDDVHVRRAVTLAVDDAELEHLQAPTHGSGVVSTHIAPDSLEGNLLAAYDPYPVSVARARQEMALSRYDRDGDGRCDVSACRRVSFLAPEDVVAPAASDAIVGWLDEVGIDLRPETGPDAPQMLLDDPREQVALGDLGFVYDYPNASTFLPYLFDSSEISGGYGWNVTLLGASSSRLRRWGYEVTEVPSVDDRLDRCVAMTGLAQTECWADLDRYLMEEVVAAVPYLATDTTFVVSERVEDPPFSVATGGLALDRMALVEGSD